MTDDLSSLSSLNDDRGSRRPSHESARPAPQSEKDTPGPILKQIEQQAGQKNRRRKPPGWAVKLTSGISAVKVFCVRTLPEYLKRKRRELETAMISILVHLLLGLLLAAWWLPATSRDDMWQLIGVRATPEEAAEQPPELVEVVQPELLQNLNVNSTTQQMLAEIEKGEHRIQIDSPDLNEITLPLEETSDAPEIPFVRGQFGGRSDAGRRAAVNHYGGNAESEKSVTEGLNWLQKIQKPDGSWSFDEVGEAGQPGMLTTTDMGATSLSLLCFLGSGNTHRTKGPYQDTVKKGLAHLLANADRSASGADLRGQSQGNSGMYVQGIATICLCEAAAMEREDRELKRVATEAVKFIERAQNKIDGGWRYNPGDAGDTSVVGWQVMALKSAQAGRITVRGSTLTDARRFLNSAQFNDGAMYGYVPGQGPQDSMTAVGLLCRMYLGWKRDNPALKIGVEHLAAGGPRPGNIYLNYYATQVLYHWGGELWTQWNLKMRQELVSTQVKAGPGAGSWDVADPHGYAGGRIYQTTLSLLTLEVYYRHLPLYRRFDDKPADEKPPAAAP